MKKIYTGISILIAALVCMICLNRCYSTKLETSEHNIKALRDSVQTLTLKNGEQASVISSYIIEKKELQNYLDISKAEVKELEKKIGKLSYVGDIKTVTQYDTIVITDIIETRDSMILYNIKYSDDWLTLDGIGNIEKNRSTITFNTIEVPVPLQVGLTDDYKIWVKSKNPYLNITSIDGAVVKNSRINRKQKRFGIGFNAGVGAQYDIIDKSFGIGPYVGVGISYNILNF